MKRLFGLVLGIVVLGSFACGSNPPEPTVSPTISCPSPCPDCPPDPWGESCVGFKIKLELDEVFLDMAEKELFIGRTPNEIRADITTQQQTYDQNCIGIVLAEPSSLTFLCARVGEWKGTEERDILYAPSAQTQIWINQFSSIIDRHCKP